MPNVYRPSTHKYSKVWPQTHDYSDMADHSTVYLEMLFHAFTVWKVSFTNTVYIICIKVFQKSKILYMETMDNVVRWFIQTDN